jgi:uncharacterized membrane protein YtjA (UPF0391 family)
MFAGRSSPPGFARRAGWRRPIARRVRIVRRGIPLAGDRGPLAGWINQTEQSMLRWALIFAVIALIAGALGFTGIEAGAADIARLLFYVFLALVVIFLLLGFTIFKR